MGQKKDLVVHRFRPSGRVDIIRLSMAGLVWKAIFYGLILVAVTALGSFIVFMKMFPGRVEAYRAQTPVQERPAAPALADSGVGGKFEEIINKIVETVQNLTLVIGLMGLVLWGFGKVARPIVPQISQLTQQYFMQFIIGIVVVFSASEIVEMIAGAVGA